MHAAPAWLPVHACMCACVHAPCLPACLHACPPACTLACMQSWVPAHVLQCALPDQPALLGHAPPELRKSYTTYIVRSGFLDGFDHATNNQSRHVAVLYTAHHTGMTTSTFQQVINFYNSMRQRYMGRMYDKVFPQGRLLTFNPHMVMTDNCRALRSAVVREFNGIQRCVCLVLPPACMHAWQPVHLTPYLPACLAPWPPAHACPACLPDRLPACPHVLLFAGWRTTRPRPTTRAGHTGARSCACGCTCAP